MERGSQKRKKLSNPLIAASEKKKNNGNGKKGVNGKRSTNFRGSTRPKRIERRRDLPPAGKRRSGSASDQIGTREAFPEGC